MGQTFRAAFTGLAVSLALFAPATRAGLFDDDEARRAILDLRQKIEQSNEQQRARQAEQMAVLTAQVEQLKRSLLDLSNQLEPLRADNARLRGQGEQLARDLADVQRRQKDIQSGVEDRMRKFEPQKVTLDGKEFSVDAEEKRQYEEAFATIRSGNFDAAVVSLYAFMRRYPNSGYTDSARFWAGNAHYGKREYLQAIASFRAFIVGAPDHARIPEAMLAVANTQVEMKDSKSARATLAELIKRYPDSEAAQAGRERLAVVR